MTTKPRMGQSPVRKRTAKVGTHSTSISMEEEFWQGLKEIARERELPLSDLLTDINKQREHANLSSAVRLFVLDHYRRLAELGPPVKGSGDDHRPTVSGSARHVGLESP